MDHNGDWEAIGMFSPSKARAQQALAKDWAVVDAWLAKKYGPNRRVPAFERNEKTLQILREIITANESADAQRAAAEKVEQAASQGLAAKRSLYSAAPYHELTDRLDRSGHTDLETLVETSYIVGTSNAAQTARRICDLTAQQFELRQNLHSARKQLETLRKNEGDLDSKLKKFTEDTADADGELRERSAEWTRETKVLRQKITDYDHRLVMINADGAPRLDISKLSVASLELEKQRDLLIGLQVEIEAHKSWSSDPEQAHLQITKAAAELKELLARRQALLSTKLPT